MIGDLRSRIKDDRGVVGGTDVLFFGVVMITFTAMVITNAWLAIDASLAVSNAAREGARTFVESDPTQAQGLSEAAMNEVMDQYGRDDGSDSHFISIDGGVFARCAVVTTTSNYDIDLISVPLFGSFGTYTISATHSERIDPFRSGNFAGVCA